MKLKLTLEEPGSSGRDIVVDAEPHAAVGAVAAWISIRRAGDPYAAVDGKTLAVRRGAMTEILRAEATLAESGLRSGDLIALSDASAYAAMPLEHAATVRVLSGPDAGLTVQLPTGSANIGRERDCAVRLRDPQVSKYHARLNVTDVIEVVDTNSSNGVIVAGQETGRVVVGPDDEIVLGETALVVRRAGSPSVLSAAGMVAFNRSPRLDPRYPGVELKAPEPPSPPQPQRLPISMLLMPILMGGVLYAITKNIASVVFVAMSPLMLVGSFIEQRSFGKRAFAEAVRLFHQSTADLVIQMQKAFEAERLGRCHEYPSTAEVVQAGRAARPMLWSRRQDQPSFLDVRLGLGTQPSRSSIEMPHARSTTAELWSELVSIADRFVFVDHVPVVGSLLESGAIGVSGPDPIRVDAARGVVAQLAGLHAPSEVMIAAVLSTACLPDWSWLKWLPHTSSEHSPISVDHLAASGPAAAGLVSALEELIESRSAQRTDPNQTNATSVVVLIDEEAPIERPRLVSLAETGPSVGVYTVWLGGDTERLPAVCRQYLEVDRNTRQSGAGNVIDGSLVTPVEVGLLGMAEAEQFARLLAPMVDAGALLDQAGDLPSTLSFLAEQGPEMASASDAVVDRWRQSNSVSVGDADPKKRDRTLRAFVGSTANGPLMLDLRAHGPHALVGGTTGSGKSEFLQTWLLGMAIGHSPERVNFLLVDYKGGSAFGDCAELPHSVGLVTDLTPRLVRRALTSLRAELTRREHVLQEWSAKDLMDLEAKERRGAPIVPSLVIVVDEFAALIQEVPEFVDGMIDIAQRGRSLGLHLILATQRPQGVIKGNLRANTNLRVALRMADADDSVDVIGSPAAAGFDPSTPGRAIAKTGPGKVLPFQTAYVGGWTSGEPAAPHIQFRDLPFGPGADWEPPPAPDTGARDLGPNDLERLVANVRGAFAGLAMSEPRKPWLPELADRYDLAKLPTGRLDSSLVFAVTDDPRNQRQVEFAFAPDKDGNLAAFGTGGSGKSTFLRSIAIAAGLSVRGGPCVVYGLDFGSRGLSMLEPLPHVGSVINGDDDERVSRLIRHLREVIDERAQRYAAVRAGSVVDYRRLTNQPDEARILLLVDGAGSFRSAYELGPRARTFDVFQSIAMDGRNVGVHVVLTGDRPSSVPASLMSVIPRRVAFRMADEMDLAMMGVPADAFDAGTPAGRGYVAGAELQVAVLAGEDSSVVSQADAIDELTQAMRKAGVAEAPAIQRLTDRVELAELPASVGGHPALGIADDTLGPIAFRSGDSFVVCGPPGSGKSTVLLALIESLRRWDGQLEFVYLGNRRSPLGAQLGWTRRAMGDAEVADLAGELHAAFQDDSLDAARFVVVIESVGDFLSTAADGELQDLIRLTRTLGGTCIVEAETAVLSQSWPLFKEARASRHGVVLQPDQIDGDNVFSTTFPRMSRAEFPEGRGVYVRAGKVTRVQVALPS